MYLDYDTGRIIGRALALLPVAVPAFLYGIRHRETRRKMLITFLAFILLLPAFLCIIMATAMALTPLDGIAVGALLAFAAVKVLRKIWGGPITVYESDVAPRGMPGSVLAKVAIIMLLVIVIAIAALMVLMKVISH